MEESPISGVSPPARQPERREKIEDVWKEYLEWTSSGPRRGPSGREESVLGRISQGSKPSTVALINDVENNARNALHEQCPETIPVAFLMALMEAAAATTSRFMLADPPRAAQYARLAFEVLWNGLSVLETTDPGA